MAKVSSRQAYTFSGKATQLHTSLQKINCILRQLKHNNHTNTTELIELDNINKELKYISKNTDNETLEITNNHLNMNNITSIISTLKELQKTIYSARKLENNIAHNDKIKQHITQRQNNFNTDTSKMINSILQRRSDPVIIHNITTMDDVITNPCRIREEVRSHYKT